MKNLYYKGFWVMLSIVLYAVVNFALRKFPDVLLLVNVLALGTVVYKMLDSRCYIQSMLTYIDNMSRQVQQEPEKQAQPQQVSVPQTQNYKPVQPIGYMAILQRS